ncbi:hypoxanthine phosphoribosyltransferase [Hymenobacter cavernae]|uniref:Hypoxanthine phosphoribosyltransferase n=1 Tax=Hymenobacter cavernae TaxID=2044852 RepID=A0ABQ1UJ95_9BACT|nr:hypoxanthine phosphoribosyltransferase [Hymenobacter cavernae]GGF20377.1 hypoxanthine phosphoribosyltransferase [Hymenobacter cavernae]
MPLSTISLHDKQFTPYLPAARIAEAVRNIATRLNQDYAGQQPLFVVVLNGSFMFAADLMKEMSIDCEVAFIRVASYQGTTSTGEVKEILGLQEEVANRHLIIVEDIVDTGHTMRELLEQLTARKPASLEVATLFTKPECLQHQLELRYVGIELPNEFIVGYGLDYDGLGRNYPDVYKVV